MSKAKPNQFKIFKTKIEAESKTTYFIFRKVQDLRNSENPKSVAVWV
jgi:hypothetical protein